MRLSAVLDLVGSFVAKSGTTQKEKSFLNTAGEVAVASELNRRHVLASVTRIYCIDVGPLVGFLVFYIPVPSKRLARIIPPSRVSLEKPV